MKNFFLIISFLFTCQITNAQDLQSQFYQAYLNISLEMWKDGISKLEAEYKKTKNPELLYQIANAAYGSLGTCFAKKNEDAAEEMVETSENYLKKFIKANPDNADAKALMAGIMGMKIALSPMKGMFLGPKSDGLLSEAIKLNDASAQVNFQKGSSLFYTPEMFGGDKEKAIVHLELARQAHEKNSTIQNWEYLNTLATLGQCYQGVGKLEVAKTTYQTALEVEPNFGWVKHQLLPSVDKKMTAAGN